MRHRPAYRALLLLLAGATGCALHRVERAPAPAVAPPPAFEARAGEGPPIDRWWEAFGDPVLDRLVDEALAGNLQIEALWARLEAASALRRQAGAPRWPAVSYDASAGRLKNRFDLNLPAGPGGEEKLQTIFTTLSTYSTSISAAYELDLFRKNDYRARAAALDAAALRDTLEATVMTLTANLVEAYFGLVSQRERVRIQSEQLDVNRTYLKLVRARFESGLATALDLHQQEGKVARSEGELAAAQAQARVAEQRIALLLGRMPTGFHLESAPSLPEPPPPPALGLPADLLTRRPDVRAAERQLVAADYRYGASIADRLPSIRLTASTSLRSTSLDTLISEPLYNLLAGLTQPIFQAGRLKAASDQARAGVREKAASFAQTLVQAVFEVESASVLEGGARAQLESARRSLEAARAALADARARYEQGLIATYLPVLTALDAEQLAEAGLLAARTQLLSQRISLYRALGGAWTTALTDPRDPKEASRAGKGAPPPTDPKNTHAPDPAPGSVESRRGPA